MYEEFFGLKEKPFSLIPDPNFVYMSTKHSYASSVLEYGLSVHGGICVVTGDVGTGKTTLIRRVLKRIDRDCTVGLITNTHGALGALLEWICLAFDLRAGGTSGVEHYRALTDFLVAEYAAGRRCVLIIDEAQNLSVETLEELRLLSNLNADRHHILQLTMVGQPELLDKLGQPELRQFAQRISVHYHIKPLDYADTKKLIRHRLSVAGGRPDIFTTMACGAVHVFSGGVPRVINTLCDTALLYGFGEEQRTIGIEDVLPVVEDRAASGLLGAAALG